MEVRVLEDPPGSFSGEIRSCRNAIQATPIPGNASQRPDWLEDKCEVIADNHFRHTIRWEVHEWIIEAREIV